MPLNFVLEGDLGKIDLNKFNTPEFEKYFDTLSKAEQDQILADIEIYEKYQQYSQPIAAPTKQEAASPPEEPGFLKSALDHTVQMGKTLGGSFISGVTNQVAGALRKTADEGWEGPLRDTLYEQAQNLQDYSQTVEENYSTPPDYENKNMLQRAGWGLLHLPGIAPEMALSRRLPGGSALAVPEAFGVGSYLTSYGTDQGSSPEVRARKAEIDAAKGAVLGIPALMNPLAGSSAAAKALASALQVQGAGTALGIGAEKLKEQLGYQPERPLEQIAKEQFESNLPMAAFAGIHGYSYKKPAVDPSFDAGVNAAKDATNAVRGEEAAKNAAAPPTPAELKTILQGDLFGPDTVAGALPIGVDPAREARIADAIEVVKRQQSEREKSAEETVKRKKELLSSEAINKVADEFALEGVQKAFPELNDPYVLQHPLFGPRAIENAAETLKQTTPEARKAVREEVENQILDAQDIVTNKKLREAREKEVAKREAQPAPEQLGLGLEDTRPFAGPEQSGAEFNSLRSTIEGFGKTASKMDKKAVRKAYDEIVDEYTAAGEPLPDPNQLTAEVQARMEAKALAEAKARVAARTKKGSPERPKGNAPEGARTAVEPVQPSAGAKPIPAAAMAPEKLLEPEGEILTLDQLKAKLAKVEATKGEKGKAGDFNESRDTPAFAKWFGDSKVVDDEGAPRVVYHGTSKDVPFTSFKAGKRGVWFTTDPESASDYAKDNESKSFTQEGWNFIPKNTHDRVIPAYLSIKNPARPTPEQLKKMRFAENYGKVQGEMFEEFRRQGYDGVDMGGGIWVAFDSNQIKSSIGNKGTYSLTKNDINEARTSANQLILPTKEEHNFVKNEVAPIAEKLKAKYGIDVVVTDHEARWGEHGMPAEEVSAMLTKMRENDYRAKGVAGGNKVYLSSGALKSAGQLDAKAIRKLVAHESTHLLSRRLGNEVIDSLNARLHAEETKDPVLKGILDDVRSKKYGPEKYADELLAQLGERYEGLTGKVREIFDWFHGKYNAIRRDIFGKDVGDITRDELVNIIRAGRKSGKPSEVGDLNESRVIQDEKERAKNLAAFREGNHPSIPNVVYHHGKQNPKTPWEVFDTTIGRDQLGTHFGDPVQAEDRMALPPESIMELAEADPEFFKRRVEGTNTNKYTLSIKNPLRLPDLGSWTKTTLQYLTDPNGVFGVKKEDYTPIPDNLKTSEAQNQAHALLRSIKTGADTYALVNKKIQMFLKEHGYDGIVYKNTGEGEFPRDSYIVFDPEQIKSLIGNSGEFSLANKDYNESRSGKGERKLDELRYTGASNFREAFREGGTALANAVKKGISQITGEPFKPTASQQIAWNGSASQAILQNSLRYFGKHSGKRVFDLDEQAKGVANEALIKVMAASRSLDAAKASKDPTRVEAAEKTLADMKWALQMKVAHELIDNLESGKLDRETYDHYEKTLHSIIEHGPDYLHRQYYLFSPFREVRERYARDTLLSWEKETQDGGQPTSKQGKAVQSALDFIANKYLEIPDDFDAVSDKTLARAHLSWTGKTWESREQAIEDLLRVKARNGDANARALDLVKAILNLSNKADTDAARTMFVRGQVNNSIIQSRSNIPEPIRQLFGEVKEEAEVAGTLKALIDFQQNLQFTSRLLEDGLANGYIRNAADGAEGGIKENLNLKSAGPLKGHLVSPRLKQFLEERERIPTTMEGALRTVYNGWGVLASLAKLNVTAWGGFGPFLNNFIGSPLQLLGNGNTDPVHMLRGFKAAWGMVGQNFKKEVHPDTAELVRNGLTESSFTGEMRDIERGRLQQILDDQMASLQKKADAGKLSVADVWAAKTHIVNALRVVKGLSIDAYSTADVWTKYANYFKNKEYYSKINDLEGFGWTPEQIEQKAAEKTKRTNLTYSRALPILKTTEKLGLTQFAIFMAETHRIMAHNLVLEHLADAKERKGFNTPEARNMSINQSIARGAGASIVASAMAAAVTAAFAGMSPEEKAKRREMDKLLADGDVNKPLIEFEDVGHKGKAYFDLSRFDPHDPVTSVARALAMSDSAPEAAEQALAELSSQLFANTASKRIVEEAASVISGKGPKNPTMKSQTPHTYTELTDFLGGETEAAKLGIGLAEPFIPKFAKNKWRAEEIERTQPDSDAALNMRLGVVPVIVEPMQRLQAYGATEFKVPLETARTELKAKLIPGKTSKEEIEKLYADYLLKVGEATLKIQERLEGAKAYGLTKAEMQKALAEGDVSKEMAAALVNGRAVYFDFTDKTVWKDIAEKREPKDEKARAKVLREYQEMGRVLNQLQRSKG